MKGKIIAYTSDSEGQIQTPCPHRRVSHFNTTIARVGSISCRHWCDCFGGFAGKQKIYCKHKGDKE